MSCKNPMHLGERFPGNKTVYFYDTWGDNISPDYEVMTVDEAIAWLRYIKDETVQAIAEYGPDDTDDEHYIKPSRVIFAHVDFKEFLHEQDADKNDYMQLANEFFRDLDRAVAWFGTDTGELSLDEYHCEIVAAIKAMKAIRDREA